MKPTFGLVSRYGVLPMPSQSLPIDWSASRLYFNMAANFSGIVL